MTACDEMTSALMNLDAEAALLGAALVENEVADRLVDTVTAGDFALPLNGRIWGAITRERALGRHVSPVTLRSLFEGDPDIETAGGVVYLMRLTQSPAALMAINDLARVLKDLSARRAVRSGLLEAAEKCVDPEVSVDDIIARADEVIRAPANDAVKAWSAGDCMAALLASLDQPQGGVSCKIIPSLDEVLGTLRPGSVTIVAGRPGMGKTAVALGYARGAAAAGHGVLFASLEMSGVELSGRLCADLCFDRSPTDRVPYSAIRDRSLTPDQRTTANAAARMIRSLPMTIVDAGSLTLGRLRNMVRTAKRRSAAAGGNLELVVVDYLQLLHPDRPARSGYEAVSEVSRGLKALAMDEQVAVMALAQLSRSVEQRGDKRPILSDLRESGQIEQDADAVLFLLRPEYYLRQAEPAADDADGRDKWQANLDRCRGVIEFIVAKRRNGPTGTTFGRFFANYQAVRGRA